MAARRGWRRVGIVLSALAFFPLGFFILTQPSPSESFWRMEMESCGNVWRYEGDAMNRINENVDLRTKRENESRARYDQCMSKALLRYESTNPPSTSTRLLMVVAIDLLLIGFGWLIAWGCVALGRWVHRGFAAP